MSTNHTKENPFNTASKGFKSALNAARIGFLPVIDRAKTLPNKALDASRKCLQNTLNKIHNNFLKYFEASLKNNLIEKTIMVKFSLIPTALSILLTNAMATSPVPGPNQELGLQIFGPLTGALATGNILLIEWLNNAFQKQIESDKKNK